MRLKITKSKNNVHYSIISDYTTINGKRTTRIFENIGNQSDLEEKFGKNNTLINVQKYIDELNGKGNFEIFNLSLDPNKRLRKGNKTNFNVGYLFLQKLYNDLNLKEICDNIQNKYQFHFKFHSFPPR